MAAQTPIDMVEARQHLEPALQEILLASAIARSDGARFVVLLINPQASDGTFAPVQWAYNAVVTAFCRDRTIEVVDPLPALVADSGGRPVHRTFDDYHWTRNAHGVAARVLHEHLRFP